MKLQERAARRTVTVAILIGISWPGAAGADARRSGPARAGKAAARPVHHGSLSIETDVPGAEVLIDGKRQPEKTPTTLARLKTGTHQVELRSDAGSWTGTVSILKDQPTTIVAMLRGAAAGGTLFVDPDVAGAQVVVDGVVQKARTPLVLAGVAQGPHRVEVRDESLSLPVDVVVEPGSSIPLALLGRRMEAARQIMWFRRWGCLQGDPWRCPPDLILDTPSAEDRQTIRWLEQDCAQGDMPSCAVLGLLHQTGYGVGLDLGRAMALYRQSCDADDAHACAALGRAYLRGQGVKQNGRQGGALLRKSCDSGYADACLELGLAYRHGTGVKRDIYEARPLLLRSCEKGSKRGCDEFHKFNAEETDFIPEGGVVDAPLHGVVGGMQGGVLLGGPGGESEPVPLPPPPLPQVVAQTALEALRIAGDKNIPPDEATKQQMQRQGESKLVAVVKMCLSADGKVTSVHMLKSSGYPGHDQKITSQIQQWQYKPYLIQGKPEPVCTALTFLYNLNNQPPAPAP